MTSRTMRGGEGLSPPAFVLILAHTGLSLIPGLSGAGRDPEDTWKTPIRDADYILEGGELPRCPTPASITRSCLHLCGIPPLFVNAGLGTVPHFPCVTLGTLPGRDPRTLPAVPEAHALYRRGRTLGEFLSLYTDTLFIGECVPGGTTTALCVLRALGYDDARCGSAFSTSPALLKEEVWNAVRGRLKNEIPSSPLAVVRETGDPMMAAAGGLAAGFSGRVVLAGGTQMLAVAALMTAAGSPLPGIATTGWLRDDPDTSFAALAGTLGVRASYADPAIDPGTRRGCIGAVKEGMGAGGAVVLAGDEGFSPDEIARAIMAGTEP